MISRKLTLAVLLLYSGITFAQTTTSTTTTTTSSFPPKPKNQWQIGLHLGVPQIMGDVKSEPFGGAHSPAFGVGLNIRKGIGYLVSVRLHGMYGNAYGQDFVVSPFSFNKTLNGDFKTSSLVNYSEGADYTGNVWVPNYKTTILTGSLDFTVNLNNTNFHNAAPKFFVYAFAGIGVFQYETQYDAIDNDTGLEYQFQNILSQFGSQNTSQKERIDAIHLVLDGEYETQAEVATPAARAADEVRSTKVNNPSLSGGLGMSYKIGKSMEIGLENRSTYFFDDLADGQRWQDGGEYTARYDIMNYTNLTFGFNIGGADAIDPLWEVNPLAYLYDAVAAFDPDNLFKDADNDGVLDQLDKEPNTAEGVPVDTHGVSLDSDKDGCPDSEDPEPFSTPQLPMENCQNIHVTMKEVREYVDQRLKDFTGGGTGAASDWILPYIFYDYNKFNIRPDAVPALNQVSEIMKRYSKLNVEVVGHADTRGGEDYNLKLSENRAKSAITYLTGHGVTENSMKIVYKGESDNLIKDANTEEEHQMNRRVEFHIIKN